MNLEIDILKWCSFFFAIFLLCTKRITKWIFMLFLFQNTSLIIRFNIHG